MSLLHTLFKHAEHAVLAKKQQPHIRVSGGTLRHSSSVTFLSASTQRHNNTNIVGFP